MIKYKPLLLLLSVLLLPLNAKAQIVETILKSSDFTYIPNGNTEEYLSFDINQPVNITFLMKSDICQLLEAKESAVNKKCQLSGYILIDGKLRPLKLDEQYAAMIPQKVYYNRTYSSVVVIEFYLYSHMATSTYRYLVLAFSDDGTISYDELDFNTPQAIEYIYRAYTNPNRVPPFLVPYAEED